MRFEISPMSTDAQSECLAAARRFLSIAFTFILNTTCLIGIVHGSEPEYLTHDAPVADSVLKEKDLLGQGMAPPDISDRRGLFILPDTLTPFLRDSSLDIRPRLYYFDRQRDDAAGSKAMAAGGAMAFQSGQLMDRLSVGATMFTTQKLYGPHDKPGSGLLEPIQQGFTVLGEAYLDLRIAGDSHVRVYRQFINLPYINKNDSRMVPNTFEAVQIFDASDPNFNYVLGHVEKIKRRASDEFVHMSEAAGATSAKKGLSMIGARLTIDDGVNVGAISQYSWDLFNTFFLEANGAWPITDAVAARLSGQFTDQRSVGDALVGDFDTFNVGFKAEASTAGAILTFAYSHTDDGARIRSPYGGYPGYISLMLSDFNRAGEDAWLLGVSYDFKYVGIPGLSGFVNFASGSTPDRGANASPDQNELDFTVDYRPQVDMLRGLTLRARAAYLHRDGGGTNDVRDYRFIANYTVPIF